MTEIYAPIVNFVVVVFVLGYFGRKPFKQTLDARRTTIANTMEEASTLAAQASSKLNEWQGNWNQMREHATQAMKDAENRIARQKELAIKHAQAEAERIGKEAVLVAETEQNRVKGQIERELAEKSISMAKSFLAGHLQEDDQHRLVGEYVELVR